MTNQSDSWAFGPKHVPSHHRVCGDCEHIPHAAPKRFIKGWGECKRGVLYMGATDTCARTCEPLFGHTGWSQAVKRVVPAHETDAVIQWCWNCPNNVSRVRPMIVCKLDAAYGNEMPYGICDSHPAVNDAPQYRGYGDD